MADESIFEKIEKIKMPIRIAIFFGTLVLFGGLFAYFVYFPKTTEIDETKNEIADLNRKLTRAKIKAKDRKKLLATKANVDVQFREALRLLPDKKSVFVENAQ